MSGDLVLSVFQNAVMSSSSQPAKEAVIKQLGTHGMRIYLGLILLSQRWASFAGGLTQSHPGEGYRCCSKLPVSEGILWGRLNGILSL